MQGHADERHSLERSDVSTGVSVSHSIWMGHFASGVRSCGEDFHGVQLDERCAIERGEITHRCAAQVKLLKRHAVKWRDVGDLRVLHVKLGEFSVL